MNMCSRGWNFCTQQSVQMWNFRVVVGCSSGIAGEKASAPAISIGYPQESHLKSITRTSTSWS